MTSPLRRPARSAALAATTRVTSAPSVVARPKARASSGVSSWIFAELAAHDAPGRAQLAGELHRQVDRDRERHAHEAAAAGVDHRVQPDDLAAQVEQRPAGAARVDRHVGLDQRHARAARQVAVCGADDAGRDTVLQPERRPHRQHPFAADELVAVARGRDHESGRVDLHEGHVGQRVQADDTRRELAAVRQTHHGLVGTGHRVGGGQDVAVGADHDAGGQIALDVLQPRAGAQRGGRRLAPVVARQAGALVVARDAADPQADHDRLGTGGDGREVRRAACVGSARRRGRARHQDAQRGRENPP
jgi:hypothetical protein